MQSSHARHFRLFLDHLDRQPPGRATHAFSLLRAFLQQHADVHPFIANQIRRVAQDSVAQHVLSFIRHSYLQLGNGCADDFQAETTNSRTRVRLRNNCSAIASNASRSAPNHSGGISLSASSTISTDIFPSTRASHGSNASTPRTDSYTRCRAYNPR